MTQMNHTLTNTALDADGIGAGLVSTGASYVLTASGPEDGLAHKITVENKSATDHSAKTIVLTGTDENGKSLTETIAAPAGTATVTSTKYFKTLTSAVPSASTGVDTFDIGWTAAAISPWYKINSSVPQINLGIAFSIASGSPNYSVRYTYDGINWFTHATITGKTAAFDGTITIPAKYYQVIFTAAGGVTIYANQAGVQ